MMKLLLDRSWNAECRANIFLERLTTLGTKGGTAGSKNELSNPTSTQIYREDLQIVGTDFYAINTHTFHLLFDNRFALDFHQLSGGKRESGSGFK